MSVGFLMMEADDGGTVVVESMMMMVLVMLMMTMMTLFTWDCRDGVGQRDHSLDSMTTVELFAKLANRSIEVVSFANHSGFYLGMWVV